MCLNVRCDRNFRSACRNQTGPQSTRESDCGSHRLRVAEAKQARTGTGSECVVCLAIFGGGDRLQGTVQPSTSTAFIVFQTGQARWADTSTVLFGPVRKLPGPAATVPVPSTARPCARAWAAMPARWHGTGTACFNGRHGGGTASSRWMEPPPADRWI